MLYWQVMALMALMASIIINVAAVQISKVKITTAQ